MIHIASCHISPCVASLMLDDFPCIERNHDFSRANEIAPIAFSHIFGDFDIILVKHDFLTSLHHIPSAMNIAIVASYYSWLCAREENHHDGLCVYLPCAYVLCFVVCICRILGPCVDFCFT